jgi:hypothetical protein
MTDLLSRRDLMWHSLDGTPPGVREEVTAEVEWPRLVLDG